MKKIHPIGTVYLTELVDSDYVSHKPVAATSLSDKFHTALDVTQDGKIVCIAGNNGNLINVSASKVSSFFPFVKDKLGYIMPCEFSDSDLMKWKQLLSVKGVRRDDNAGQLDLLFKTYPDIKHRHDSGEFHVNNLGNYANKVRNEV